MKNNKIIILIIAMVILGTAFILTREKSYNIRITIPASSSEAFIYSDEEISPKGNTITLYAGEGMGDGEIVLKPVEVKEENIYEPTYITPGMPVKMDVEKGTWFKIGVNNMKNFYGEDIDVYIKVSNVDLRIE